MKIDELKTDVDNDTKMAEELVQGKKYKRIERTRKNNGQEEVLVYEIHENKEVVTKWVSKSEANLEEIAYILADNNKNPLTADTDTFLIGIPGKSKRRSSTYSPATGHEFPFAKSLRTLLNTAWKNTTENENDIVQHGDESQYGLNTIDDVIVAASGNCRHYPPTTPEIKRFNLKRDQTLEERDKQITEYGKWLAKESESKVQIPIPTFEQLQERRNKLKKAHPEMDPPKIEGPGTPGCDYAKIRLAMETELSPKDDAKLTIFKQERETRCSETHPSQAG